MWRVRDGWFVHQGLVPHEIARRLVGGTAPTPDTLACPATIGNFRVIGSSGMVCPPPTNDRAWRFCGHFTPMSNQRKAVSSMLRDRRSLLLDDPGTGKTMSGIWAADAMFARGALKRLLIVAPLSVVDGAWEEHLFVHTDWRVANLCRLPRARRELLLADPRYNVYVINPESLHSVVPTHLFDGCIVDEATCLKTPSSRRTKHFVQYVNLQNPWFVLMTGTPHANKPEDAYMLVRLVNPKADRLSSIRWRDMVAVRMSDYLWKPRANVEKILFEWLQPASRTSRDEVLELPPKRTYDLPYHITPAQQKALKALKDEAHALLDGGQSITAANAAAVYSKMLQTLCGSIKNTDPITGEESVVEVDASTWVEAVQEFVAERSRPVLVFVPFRRAAARLGEALSCPVITGSTHKDERQKIYRQINENQVQAVVAVASTMSHGLTLTGATSVLWALPPVSAEQYEQANARIYRKGQKKAVDIVRMIGHNVSKSAFQRVETGLSIQQAVMDMFREV